MARVSAAMVKELSRITGDPVLLCRKALVEADGDFERAIDVLRIWSFGVHVEHRPYTKGSIAAFISDDRTVGALAEVACDTDFVATSVKFKGFVSSLAKVVAECDPADVDALLACPMHDGTVQDALQRSIFGNGESQKIVRFVRIATDGVLVSYVQHDDKHACIIEFAVDNPETARDETFLAFGKDVAMQCIATRPVAATREDVPEDKQERIAQGNLEKFFRENVLAEQAFVKDGSMTVAQLANRVSREVGDSIQIRSFVRLDFGE